MTEWYGAANRINLQVTIDTDFAADQVVPLFRAPIACELREAYAIMTDAVAAHADNHIALKLMNGGTAGTATTVISGTIGGVGGWTALLPVDFEVSTHKLTAGQVVVLNYDESGTVTPCIPMYVQLQVQMNKGEETIEAEIAVAQAAIDALKDSIDAEIAKTGMYLSDTLQFQRSMSADLDKMSRRLADDQTECAARWHDRL